jgi:hypothetical protein
VIGSVAGNQLDTTGPGGGAVDDHDGSDRRDTPPYGVPAPGGEPPAGHSRAAGGLLGAVAGEAWRAAGPPTRFASTGSVATAMVELARAYVARDGDGAPTDVAARHDGDPAPAWLLVVAIVRPRSRTLSADALQLARAAGVPGHALSHCVSYVELAAELFAGRPAPAAVEAVTGLRTPRAVSPTLCGDPHLDALTTGIWALAQPGRVAEVLPALAAVVPHDVRAAAGGLLGLRDGSNAIPGDWHRDLPEAGSCRTLAADLVRVRHHAYLGAAPPRRVATAPAAGAALGTTTTGPGASPWVTPVQP